MTKNPCQVDSKRLDLTGEFFSLTVFIVRLKFQKQSV
jgi:hypothetical protein